MSARTRLLATLAAVAVLAAGVIGLENWSPAPAVAAAPISTIAPAAAATAPVLAGPVAEISAARDARKRVTSVAAEREAVKEASTDPQGVMSDAECSTIAAASTMSNADLGPYLRSVGCDDAADGLLVGAAPDDETVGDNAVDVDTYCDPYTGMMLDGTYC